MSDKEPLELGRCCYGGMKPKSHCASCAAWQPASKDVLDKPARVGNTNFGVGVDVRLIIERAQREYEYRENPPPALSQGAITKLATLCNNGDGSALDLSGSPEGRRLTETCRRCGGLGHVKFGSQEGM